ncbi:stAR-related lipid transfer protein 9 isoform X2 [Cavia porcellus]|uniref:stAR-related lipid transfer protein 9 isoform X2 n=1 Tax=Cavia porcellus TaxID=10141 RepID=UPI00022B708A|nr:stAR-related lipid transfer protein 9 isoform X2 [Cavia porcellus]
MATVRVAVRVRPLSKRESKEGGKIIVEIDDKVAKIRSLKVGSRPDGFGDSREKIVAFSFDYCYWSVNPEDPQYASQDVVFQDLGTEVLSGAAEGYNICLFAYGQTGSGKTYTMLGTPASVGLTPRICEGLFRKEDCASLCSSCRIKVSFLEIYNERVRDLLKQSDQKKSYTLRVREHPEMGPYVQGLSQHVVTNYKQVIQLLEEGIANRITAATHVHEASSRSHAIFTIYYSQAIVENNLPSEIVSKINLVDLAGSERADPSYCKDRIIEGANINKSLVTLGIVISTLAQNSQAFSNCQGLSSSANSSGDNSGITSNGGPSQRQSYIPYRDSVLTWLLKDSLGGNSKTIMIATVSPAHTSYTETMSTLRYASSAKNIINKPRVNEDANVKLIRELKEEIRRLKAMLLSFELRNFSSLHDRDENLKELVLQNELKMDRLTKDWTQKWHEWQALIELYSVDISRRKAGVVIDSRLPHLMALDDDVLSTGVVLYHLKEGTTKIGRIDSDQEQDIVLQGQWIERDHCTITSACGVVILRPVQGARCTVNGREVTASCRLTQGAVITLGKAQKFRFSHPAEAAVLRRRKQVGEAIGSNGSLEWLNLDADVTASRLGLCPFIWKERRVLEELSDKDRHPPRDGERSHRAQIQQWQCCVADLKQGIQAEQIGAKKKLEFDQIGTRQKIGDNQQWPFREETWLANLQEQQKQQDNLGTKKESEASVALDTQLQTDSEAPLPPLVRSQKNRLVQLHLPQRRVPQAGKHNILRKKASLQLDGYIKKLKLLEVLERLKQLTALSWLQDDSTYQSPRWVPTSDAAAPESPCRSRSTSDSSLNCQTLGGQHLPPLHSAFLNGDLSTMLPPMPDPAHQVSEKITLAGHVSLASSCLPRIRCLHRSGLCLSGQGHGPCMAKKDTTALGTCLTVSHKSVDIQEMQSMGKQLSQMVFQGLTSFCQSTDKLKSRDGPKTFTSATQVRRDKGLPNSGSAQAVSQKEGNLGVHKAAKGASYSYYYPRGLKQVAGLGRVAKTFRTESKLPLLGRESKRLQKVLATRVRDIAKKYCPLPHGHPLKKQHRARDQDAPHTDSSPVMDCARGEDNLSDTDSNCSVDSLSHAYAKASLKEPLILEHPRGKWYLPESENSESHNSQISEDSLVEKRDQSSKENLGGSHPTNERSCLKTGTKASMRGFLMPSDSGFLARAHRSFSLDSLIDAEEELEEDQQEEPFLGSADEMPTEIFWHLQKPIVDQETTYRSGPISHRAKMELNTILPLNSSFYLNPQVHPHKEWPESELEARYPEGTSSFQDIQLSRGNSRVSIDSWFSCDSKINPSSPPGIEGSSLLIPDVQNAQPSDEERFQYLQNIKELKPPGAETVLPGSLKLPQGSTELPCNTGDVLTAFASGTSKLSLWRTQRLLQPVTDDLLQRGGNPDTTQPRNSEVSSVSSEPAASGTSFIYVGSTHEGDWAALQQKYLLELSQPVLEAVGESRQPFPYLEEDSSSLAKNSDKGGGIQLSVGSAMSSSQNLNEFPIHLSKTRHLRAEKKQDSLSAKLENASDFVSTSEKEVSCNGAYSADLESLASGSTNVQICATENKTIYSLKEACEVRHKSLEECCQGSRKLGVMTASDKYVLQKNACCRNVAQATKADHWPQGQCPLRESSSVQQGQLSHNSSHSQQEEKADCQKNSEEVVGRHTDVSFALPSGPELYLHSAPWNPFISSPQPSVLETFYVTKSRDALTETALEIPACREVWVPSPPPCEAWGFSHDHQILKKTYLNSFPVLLQPQNSKIAFSQQVTAEKPVDLNTNEVTDKLGECAENTRKESHNSVHFLVAQNRHFLPFTGTEVFELENEVGILNNKHTLPVLQEREKAPTKSCWSIFSDNSGSGKPFIFIYEPEISRKKQAQIQAHDMSRQLPSESRSDFICKTIDLGLEKDTPGETAVFMKSRSVCDRVTSSTVTAQETGLLGETVHPRDSPAELKLSERVSTCERVPSVICYQESGPSECQGPKRSQEMLNSKKEHLRKKQFKRFNNADEMARLIKSVMQLENGILEIGSKQNKQLYASHTPGVSEEVVSQERADHDLRPGSSGNYLSCKDQSSSPRRADDVVFRDSEAREMETNRTTGNKNQVQKMPPSPVRSRECVQESQIVVEHTHRARVGRSPRDMGDSSGRGTACKKSTRTTLHQKRMKVLCRAPPLYPWLENSGKEVRLVQASAKFKEQPWGLENLEDLETVEVFQESQVTECINSSKPNSPRAQGEIEEMALQMGGRPTDKSNMVSLTQKHPGPNQHSTCIYFSQETISPLLSQTDFSMAPSNRNLSNTLSLPSPKLPGSCFQAPDTIGNSLVDHVLDPTILKIPDSPSEHGVGYDSQSRENRRPHVQGEIRRGSSAAYSAWDGDVRPLDLELHGQSDTAESVPLGTQERITVNTSPKDQGGDLGVTSIDLSAQEGFGSETEAAVQKEIPATPSKTVSTQLDKRVSFSLEEEDDQSRGARQKSHETEDQGPASRAHSASISMPRVPDLDPRVIETSVHASICLAILEEIRQAKFWRKWPSDFRAENAVLTYRETSVEPECSSGDPNRTHTEQINQLTQGRTRHKGETPEGHVASLSAAPQHLLADKRKDQATHLCIDGSGSLPSSDMNSEPQLPPQSASFAAPAPGKRYCPRDLWSFQESREGFVDHSSSSTIIEKKKEVFRTPSSAGPLILDRLLPPGAVEADRMVGSEKAVSALSSQAPHDDPGPILCGQRSLAAWHTGEGMSPGSCTSSPEHQEPEAIDTTYGELSGNFLVTAQGRKTALFESQSVIRSVERSLSFSEIKQDHNQCPEASTGLEDVRANPGQQVVLPGAQRNAELEFPTQQSVKWEENVGVRIGSKNLRPTPLLDQRPGPDPRRDEALCRGPEETGDCPILPGATEGSRALSTVRDAEEIKTVPCQQLCCSQTTAAHTCSSHSSTLLCHRHGDLGTNSQAVPCPVYPPFIVPSRACEMDEIGETSSKEADMFLAHGSEPKGMDFGPADGVLGPSTAAAVGLPPQGCSSLCTSSVRTHSLTPSATNGSLRTVEDLEEKVAKRKVSTEFESAPCLAGMHSEPLRNLRDHFVGGQNAQVFQTKREPPAETQGPHIQRLSEEFIESEHGCLENSRCLSEKPQPSTESRDPPAKFVAKHICSSQGDSPWEDKEQQRDWPSGGGKDRPQGRNLPLPDQGSLNSHHIRGAEREEVAVTTFPASQAYLAGFEDPAPMLLGHSEVQQPAAQRPGQLYSNEEQSTPHHRCSFPMTAVFSGPKHSSRSNPRSQFSVVSSSQSLQELNMRVEPPSPDKDAQGLHGLWNPHLPGYSSAKMMTGTPLKTEDSNPMDPFKLNSSPADHMPLKSATPPYPVSSTVSGMPTPDFMNSWVSGTMVPQGEPEKLDVQVRSENGQIDKGMLCLGSSDINPCFPPWCPEGPMHIGWKQYVFGRAVNVPCSQKALGPVPSNVAWCSSMDNSLGDQNPPFLSTYTQTQDLSSTHGSTENVQDSNETWNILGTSFALGCNPSGPDKIPQFKDPTSKAGCLKSGLPLAEGSSVGTVDEIVLLYPSETDSHLARARTNTYEQGTQTSGCQLHQSCADVFSAQPDTSVVSPCDLASLASMHNLSLHLSQLLNSTSELLGSLSHPGVAKEQTSKRDPSAGALHTLRLDSGTQTCVEKDSQTDLTLPPLHLQAPEAKTQEVIVIPEVLSSDTTPESQVTGALERDAEEVTWKATVPSDLHEESAHCRLRSPPVPSLHLRFQKALREQNLSSVSPPASLDASQARDASYVIVNNTSLSTSHTPGPFPTASESAKEPQVQEKLDPTSALVDRASSPILTFSASTQELGPPLGFLTFSASSTCPLECHQKLDFSPRPAADSCSQITHEPGGFQPVEALGGKGSSKSFLESSPPCSPPQSLSVQVSFLEQPLQQPQPSTTTGGQSSPPPPPPRHCGQKLTDSFVSVEAVLPEHGPRSSQGPSQWQSRPKNGGESAAPLVEPQFPEDLSSSWKGPLHHNSCPAAELTEPAGTRGSTAGSPQACHLQGVLCPGSQMCMAPEPHHCSLRQLPVHNKFSNWFGVQHGSRGLGVNELEASSDLSSGEQGQMFPQLDNQNPDPEWSPREQVSLQVGAQSTPLSVELTEAKLHHGFGQADALLQVLQRGTGAALAPDEAVMSTREEFHARQRQTAETLKREQAERLQNFRRTRSLSPHKGLSLQPNRAFPSWDLDLPSKRREYLQQLRKDVVETTRSPESALSSAHPPTDMERMLRNYRWAREKAKVEIAQARERLRERTAQEKLRIHQQIVSQLLKEEEKLHNLAHSSSPCTSSSGSLSSGITSGYNSSSALSGQLQSPESVRDSHLPGSRETWMVNGRSRSAFRNSHMYLAGSTLKSSAYGHRGSVGTCCWSPSSLSSLGTCFSSSYQDLAKHIVDTSMADVMAACSDNLHNLFSCEATAGWNYQGKEQEVQLYYKEFSSTRHGFLGAGMVVQPLSHVWAAVSDPTLWPLYHKPIQTARLHQRVTKSISLVYLVCNASLCALKQPRDFCCVCVEAKEGHLSVMAAQSVYDTSMPRPSRQMVRGEILPSAWILQPVTMGGKEITRVIYLAQVELGAPGFPPHHLSSFVRQQPLIVARLASFLGS